MHTAGAVMAKKKTKPSDKHASGFMVRLPEAYRAKLAELKLKQRRPMTQEIQIAIDAHLRANGIEPPPVS